MVIKYFLVVIILYVPYVVSNLVFSAQLINTGARFPKNATKSWVTHPGDLTKIGMRQLYILGRELRAKYINTNPGLIQSRYSPQEVQFKAAYTNSSSMISSGYAFLRGLYSAGSGQFLTDYEAEYAVPPNTRYNYSKYQEELRDAALTNYLSAIPVMANVGGPDYLLSAVEHCPAFRDFESKAKDQRASDEELMKRWEELEKEAEKTFKELGELFETHINTTEKFLEYMDYVRAAEYYGEKSVSPECKKVLEEVYIFRKYTELFYNKDIARAVTKNLTEEIFPAMRNAIIHPNDVTRFMTYFTDDATMFAFLRMFNSHMDITNAKNISFASIIRIDVSLQVWDFSTLVRVYLDNQSIFNGKSTEAFIELFKPLMDDKEFKSICGLTKEKENEYNDKAWIIIGAICFVVVLAMFIVSWIYVLKIDKPKDEKILQGSEMKLEESKEKMI